jgi:hypothetical protein
MCNIRKTAATGLFQPKIAYTSSIGIRLPKLIVYTVCTSYVYSIEPEFVIFYGAQESIPFWAQYKHLRSVLKGLWRRGGGGWKGVDETFR